MTIFESSDTKRAICCRCEEMVVAVFQRRDVPLSDDSDIVKDVLVGVCNQCDAVILLPHQSTPAVKEVLVKQRGS